MFWLVIDVPLYFISNLVVSYLYLHFRGATAFEFLSYLPIKKG